MKNQDHAARACATRDNRKTTQNGVPKQHKMSSSERHILDINSAPIGDEPREEYHAGFVSWAVTRTSLATICRRKAEKGGRELTQDPQMLVL